VNYFRVAVLYFLWRYNKQIFIWLYENKLSEEILIRYDIEIIGIFNWMWRNVIETRREFYSHGVNWTPEVHRSLLLNKPYNLNKGMFRLIVSHLQPSIYKQKYLINTKENFVEAKNMTWSWQRRFLNLWQNAGQELSVCEVVGWLAVCNTQRERELGVI